MGLLIISITSGSNLINSAKTRSIISEIKGIETGLYAYYARNNDWPASPNSPSISFNNNCKVWQDL